MNQRFKNLGLAWRFAWRDLRGGLRGFYVFLACLVLGVTAIATVGTLSKSFVAGLDRDGTALLGGDLDLRLTHRSASAEQLAFLKKAASQRSDTLEMRTMARPMDPNARRALVELKAIDDAYPLVGTLATEPAGSLSGLLEKRDGAWGAVVDKSLLVRQSLTIGDKVRVGEAVFQLRAVILKEPDRVASVFSFGPRLMVSRDAVPTTKLIQPGSQIRYHHRLILPPGTDVEAFKSNLTNTFPEAGWRMRSADDAAPGVRRFVDRLTLFMTFVGLTVLLVGGIGITNAVTAYMEGRASTIATMKCLGASGGLVFTTYFIQVMILASAGTIIGVGLGALLPWAGIKVAGGLLPVAPEPGVYWTAIGAAGLFGLLSAMTFALWPLARARDVRAADLFRDQVAPSNRRPRPQYLAIMGLGMIGLAMLTVITATDQNFAYWFVGVALLTLCILRFAAWAVINITRRMKRPANARVRLIMANMARRNSMVPSVVTSLGMGLVVLVAVALIDVNLTRQVNEQLPERAPAFFFLDIQPHQVDAFDRAVTDVAGTANLQRVPSLRGRITHIDGQEVAKVDVQPDAQWAVRGDRALTYAGTRPEASAIVAGKWWPSDYSGPPLISLDDGLAHGFGVTVGDSLTLNVLGRPITAEIASLREIDWRSLRFDFAIIFAPGALEAAPHTHIAAVEAPVEAEDAVERRIADTFVNVSAIRVREALEAAANLVAGIGWAVRATASITIAAGALVLAGAIASGHRRRVYDAVVFKVLGAARMRVISGYLVEYGMLGVVTAVIGGTIGTLVAWGIVVHLMKSEWVFDGPVVLLTALFCVIITLGLGLVGTWKAMGQKPLGHLRNQ